MVIRWLDESPQKVRQLGVPPQSCIQNPAFVSCYGAQAAQAIAECEHYEGGVRGECQLYFNDYFAYTHCRNLCPNPGEFTAPIKPASMTTPFPPGSGGGTKPPQRLPPGSGAAATESKTSPGLVIAAIAIVGVVAYVAFS